MPRRFPAFCKGGASPTLVLIELLAPRFADYSAISADTASLFSCFESLLATATINRMPKVLLCPPNYFDVVDQKNPYM